MRDSTHLCLTSGVNLVSPQSFTSTLGAGVDFEKLGVRKECFLVVQNLFFGIKQYFKIVAFLCYQIELM